MSRRMSMTDEEQILRLAEMPPFERIVYRFGLLSRVTAGVKISRVSIPAETSIDQVYKTLQRAGARDFDSGLSSAEITKLTKLGVSTVRRALGILRRRNLIRYEKKGKKIKYYLPLPITTESKQGGKEE